VIIIEPRSYQARWSLSWGILLIALITAALFVTLAQRPLSHTDLWGHLAYGRYYEQLGFPQSEPFLTHSTDAPYVATSWLSQWLGYQIHQVGGPTTLQFTYAALVCGVAIVFLLTIKDNTNSLLLSFTGTTWLIWLEYQQLLTIRPQLAGILCFVLFLLMLSHRTLGRLSCLGFAILLIFWTNLHGSFVIAPVTLCLIIAGRSLDVFRNCRRRDVCLRESLTRVCRDKRLQQLCTVVVIMLLSTLINPYGVKLWWEVLTFSQSHNLYDLIEWKPLWKTPKQGTAVLISLVATSGLLLLTRCRLRAARWLPVVVFGVLMLKTSRYLVWWVPLFILAVMPILHLHTRRLFRFRMSQQFSKPFVQLVPGGVFVLLILGTLTIFFTISDRALQTSHPDFLRGTYSRNTPVEASLELNKLFNDLPLDDSAPLIFNTMEWGDWLIWNSDAKLPVFVNSHVPLIEEQAWKDYMSFIRQSDGWKERWQTYHFSAALIQHRRHDRLAKSLENDPEWREVWKDQIAVIYWYQPRPK